MMGAEMLAMLMGYSGKVAVLGDFTRATPFIERFSGFCEFTEHNYPDIQIHPCAHASSHTGAMTLRLIEQFRLIPDIRGVFCTGFTGTIGAIDAMRELSREDVLVVGYDLTPTTAKAMRDGVISSLIYQDPYQHGFQAAKALARHLMEAYMPEKPYLYVENRIILRSNLDAYI